MTDFMRQLQTFSQEFGVSVIVSFMKLEQYTGLTHHGIKVINNTASKGQESSERKPALGPSFALMTDTTLWLQRNQNTADDDSTVHSISVLRSRSIVCTTLLLLVSLTDLITPAHLRSGPISNSQQCTLPRMSLTFLRLCIQLWHSILLSHEDTLTSPHHR